MNQPHVSLVIIAHNEEKNIGDCLSSVSRLDYPREKLEVIVVDSSSDRTREIVRSHSHVRLIPSANPGFSSKRNEGWRASSHELVAFLDGDCMAPEDWLRRTVKKLGDTDVAAVGSNAYPPPGCTYIGLCIACLGKPGGGAIGFDSETASLERGVTFVGSGCSVFRKGILMKTGGFDETLLYGNEDVELSERIRSAGHVLEYEPDAYVYHKTRDTFREFAVWAFRRGKAQYFVSSPSWRRILFEPFSLLWPVTGCVVAFLFPPALPFLVLAAVMMLVGPFVVTLFLGREGRFYPTGRRKLKLLVERRKRIGVGMWTILFAVIPLFYLDRTIMNIAQLCCKVRQSRARHLWGAPAQLREEGRPTPTGGSL